MSALRGSTYTRAALVPKLLLYSLLALVVDVVADEVETSARFDIAKSSASHIFNLSVSDGAASVSLLTQTFLTGADTKSISNSIAVFTTEDLISNRNSSSAVVSSLFPTSALEVAFGNDASSPSTDEDSTPYTVREGTTSSSSRGAITATPMNFSNAAAVSVQGLTSELDPGDLDSEWTIVFSTQVGPRSQGLALALVQNIHSNTTGEFPILETVAGELAARTYPSSTTTSLLAASTVIGAVYLDGPRGQIEWVTGTDRLVFTLDTSSSSIFDEQWHMVSLVSSKRGKQRNYQLFIDASTAFFSDPQWRQCIPGDQHDARGGLVNEPSSDLLAAVDSTSTSGLNARSYPGGALVLGVGFKNSSSSFSIFDVQLHGEAFNQRRIASLGSAGMAKNLKVSRLFAAVFASVVLILTSVLGGLTAFNALYEVGGYDPLGWKEKENAEAREAAKVNLDQNSALLAAAEEVEAEPATEDGPLEQEQSARAPAGDQVEEENHTARKKSGAKKLAQRGAQRAVQATVSLNKSSAGVRSTSPLRQLALIVPLVLHVIQGVATLLRAWDWPEVFQEFFTYTFFIFSVDFTTPELNIPVYVTLILQLVLCGLCLLGSYIYSKQDDKTFSLAMIRYKAMQIIYEDLLVYQLGIAEGKILTNKEIQEGKIQHQLAQYLSWSNEMMKKWKQLSASELENEIGLSPSHANELSVMLRAPPKDAFEAMLMSFSAKTNLEFDVHYVGASLRNGMPVRESFRTGSVKVDLNAEALTQLIHMLNFLHSLLQETVVGEESKVRESLLESSVGQALSSSQQQNAAAAGESPRQDGLLQSPDGKPPTGVLNPLSPLSNPKRFENVDGQEGGALTRGNSDPMLASPLRSSNGAGSPTFGSPAGRGAASSPMSKKQEEDQIEGALEEKAMAILHEVREILAVPIAPPTVVPPRPEITVRLTHIRQVTARSTTPPPEGISSTYMSERKRSKLLAQSSASRMVSVKEDPLTDEEQKYSQQHFPTSFTVRADGKTERNSRNQLVRSCDTVVKYHALKEGFAVSKVLVDEDGGKKRTKVIVEDCVPYVYVVDDDEEKEEKKEEAKKKGEDSPSGAENTKSTPEKSNSGDEKKKEEEDVEEHEDIHKTRAEIRLRLKFPVSKDVSSPSNDGGGNGTTTTGGDYTEEIFRVEVVSDHSLRCPDHGTHMVPATEDRHYLVRAPDGRSPYHCTFSSDFGFKQTRDPSGVRACKSEELYVCSHDDCPYTICDECARLDDSYAKIARLKVAKLLYTIKHLKNGLIPVLVLLLLQALLLPVTQNCFMIMSCHPLFQCELGSCFRSSPVEPVYIVTLIFAIIVFIFFRCGLAVFWSLLLLRRRYFLRDRAPSMTQWDMILTEDQSVMSALYRKYEYYYMAIEPGLVMAYQVGIALATAVPEPNSAPQLVLAALVETAYGVFLALTNPFIDPWVDLLAKIGSVHQLLQISADSFHRVAQHDDPQAEWVGGLMIFITITYLVFVFFVLWRTVVQPLREQYRQQRAEGLLRQEKVHVAEPEDARALTSLQHLLKEKRQHYGKRHFQTAITMAHCYARATQLSAAQTNSSDSKREKLMESWLHGTLVILRKTCKGILEGEEEDLMDEASLNGFILSKKEREHLGLVIAKDVPRPVAGSPSPTVADDNTAKKKNQEEGDEDEAAIIEIDEDAELAAIPLTELLLEVIKRSAWDVESSDASTNAISLLSGSKTFEFKDLSFKGVRIPWSVVEDAKMMRVDFTGADLTGSSFVGSFCQNMNFDKAVLTQAKFGMKKSTAGEPSLKQITTQMRIKSLAWYPNEAEVAVVGEDPSALIFNLLEGKVEDIFMRPGDSSSGDGPASSYFLHPKANNSVSLSAESDLLATGCLDGSVRLWNLEGIREYLHEETKEANPNPSANNERPTVVVVASEGGGAEEEMKAVTPPALPSKPLVNPEVEELDKQKELFEKRLEEITSRFCYTFPDIHKPNAAVNVVAFSPDDSKLLTAGEDKQATIISFDVEELMRQSTTPEKQSSSTSVGASEPNSSSSPPTTTVNTANGGGETEPPSSRPPPFKVIRLEGHKWPVSCAAWSPDGLKVFTGSADKTIRVWDAKLGFERGQYTGHTTAVVSLAVSPTGKMIASAGTDKIIQLWDPLLDVRDAPKGSSSSSIVTGSFSGSSRGRSTSTIGTTKKKTLSGHTNTVQTLRFGPEGKRLMSGSQDGTLRLWDVVNATETGLFEGHRSTVYSLAFSPDGSRVVSGSWDKTIRVWDTTPGK